MKSPLKYVTMYYNIFLIGGLMEILKGNAVVGQSGGPTAAINATLSGVIRGALRAKRDGYIGTLYGMRNGIEGFLREDFVDLTDRFEGGRELDILEQTPAAALGSCRKKMRSPADDPETYSRIFEIFKKYDIRYFFYIGGNDSMDTVSKLSSYAKEHDYELRVVGVPKTIDNDLILITIQFRLRIHFERNQFPFPFVLISLHSGRDYV